MNNMPTWPVLIWLILPVSRDHRALQERFDTRRLADNVEKRVVLTEIPPEHKTFIESRDMFFLSTIDHQGRPTSNHVRFTPESGHVQCGSACPLWANSGHHSGNGSMPSAGVRL
jgi:Pyridoxamine 5'-phosphate oxidase